MFKHLNKSTRPKASISTASLPDIVFMLLFFFMITTVMRTTPELVEVQKPSATAVTTLKKRSLVDHIRLGYLPGATQYDSPRLQLDDALAEIEHIGDWKQSCMKPRPDADLAYVLTALHIDREVKMEEVTPLKRELRKAKCYKISYVTTTKGGNDRLFD